MSKTTERRKLLQEMERVFKLIKEGLDDFDAKFKEARQAPTKQIKEKFTEELAKKLTKLKRFRENVMTWTNHRDVKDKTEDLEEMRLNIEMRMESYRAMEKEDKIKPFSERALEMEPKVDPKDKERDDLLCWFRKTINELNERCEPWEAELEKLGSASSASSSKRNHQKINRYQTEKAETLKKLVAQHRTHVGKLELILRALHNDCLTIDDVQRFDLKTRVQNIVDVHDETFPIEDDTEMYADILELLDNFDSCLLVTSPTSGDNKDATNDASSIGDASSADNASSANAHSSHTEFEGSKKKQRYESKSSGKFFAMGPRRRPATPTSSNFASNAHPATIYNKSIVHVESQLSSELPRLQNLPYNIVAATGVACRTLKTPIKPSESLTKEVNEESEFHPLELLDCEDSFVDFGQDCCTKRNDSQSPTFEDQNALHWIPPKMDVAVATQVQNSQSTSSTVEDFAPLTHHQFSPPPPPALKEHSAPSQEYSAVRQEYLQPRQEYSSPREEYSPPREEYSPPMITTWTMAGDQAGMNGENESYIDLTLAFNPLGCLAMTDERRQVLHGLEKSMKQNIAFSDPATFAANRTMHSSLKARVSFSTRAYYPIESLRSMCFQDFYDELKNETLVWIFYYMERTCAQRGAIASLQKRGWMYHTRDRRWYCRIDERAAVSEDYEEGRFGYIDYEDWDTKTTAKNFAFQYRYLGSPVDPLPYVVPSLCGAAPMVNMVPYGIQDG